MELLVVVIIISIITAFAIPNYQNSVARTHEKDMIANVRAMASAEQIFLSDTGDYWPIPAGITVYNTASINDNLRLGLIENNVVYSCIKPAIGDAACWGTYGGGAFTVMARSTINNWQPFCAAGTCPTCTAGGCPNP